MPTHQDAYAGTTAAGTAERPDVTGALEPWSPRDPRLTPVGWKPVPTWARAFRQEQWDAALEVCEAFDSGCGLVFVDAPTGAGKTLLADLITRLMAQPGLYLCTTKSLQDQVLEDFEYARVLKGKANYPTMFEPYPEYSGEDCAGARDCHYCAPIANCPYRVAKQEAIRSQLAVINMAYWLREANYVRQPAFSLPPDPKLSAELRGRRRRDGGLIIIDECDTLEDQLLSFIEFSLSKARLRELKLEPPKKGVHKATIVKWMDEQMIPALVEVAKEYAKSPRLEDQRKARGMEMMVGQAKRVMPELIDENWLRDYEREEHVPLSLKPVRVDGYGPEMLWRHGGKFVLMSATIISPEEMANTLGYTGQYATVRVPMSFDPAQRPIIVAGVANMTFKTERDEFPKLVKAICNILKEHPDDRVLIHTVSYGRTKTLMQELRRARTGRPLMMYLNANEREHTLAAFRERAGAVLLAPSFERGIDLADDDCRVQIVAKMPYPNTSDPRVNARSHGPDGEGWMAVQTIRSLVQMTGRAVRSADDWCVTYILDQQFMSRVWKRNRNLIPEWWREAVDTRYRVRDLLK